MDVMCRLAGEEASEAVIQLQTSFGGGKTNTLLALYHLFKHINEIETWTPCIPNCWERGRPGYSRQTWLLWWAQP